MTPFEQQTYYEILEVPPSASDEDIRAAYERLMEMYAPDSIAIYALAEPGQVDALRARMTEAWEILTDGDLRVEYDRTIGVAAERLANAVAAADAPTSEKSEKSEATARAAEALATAAEALASAAGAVDAVRAAEEPEEASKPEEVATQAEDAKPTAEAAPEVSATPAAEPPREAEKAPTAPVPVTVGGISVAEAFRSSFSQSLSFVYVPAGFHTAPAANAVTASPSQAPAPTREPTGVEQGSGAIAEAAVEASVPAPMAVEARATPEPESMASEPAKETAEPPVAAASPSPEASEPVPPEPEAASSAPAAQAAPPRSEASGEPPRAEPGPTPLAEPGTPVAEEPARTPSASEPRAVSRPMSPVRGTGAQSPRPPPLPNVRVMPRHPATPPSPKAPVAVSESAPPEPTQAGPAASEPAARAPARRQLGEAQVLAQDSAIATAESALAQVAARVREARPRGIDIPPDAEFNGELLRRVREARGLTIQQLADRTRISVRHLENVEADRYGSLPTTVYLRGILMNLARELGLDPLRVSKSYLALASEKAGKAGR